MQQLLAADLRETTFPDRLPDNTQLKVWVRSTGYEVRFTERHKLSHPLIWLMVIAGLFALAFYLRELWPIETPYNYVVFALPFIVAFVLIYRIFVSTYSNVRLDITPMTIAINTVGKDNRLESQEHVPLREIESFNIDENRGLGLNSTISEILYRTWVGRGLHTTDLIYLARLISESSKLSMQSPHPGSI